MVHQYLFQRSSVINWYTFWGRVWGEQSNKPHLVWTEHVFLVCLTFFPTEKLKLQQSCCVTSFFGPTATRPNHQFICVFLRQNSFQTGEQRQWQSSLVQVMHWCFVDLNRDSGKVAWCKWCTGVSWFKRKQCIVAKWLCQWHTCISLC